MKRITVSIQAADLLDLRTEINKYISAGVDAIHFDVMDHNYANNFAFSVDTFKYIRKDFGDNIEIDIHLMITNPKSEIEKYIELKPNSINIDANSMSLEELKKIIIKINNKKIKSGIAIQLHDDFNKYKDIIPLVNNLLIMSVPIGKAGQKFDMKSLKIIDNLSSQFNMNNKLIGLDGGIRWSNYELIRDSVVNWIVIGSMLKGEKKYGETIRKLRAN